MDNADFLARIRTADTFIFSPASRPEMIGKALNQVSSPAIICFGNAIARNEKQQTRHNLGELSAHAAASHGGAIVRVNAPADGQFLLDMEFISNILDGAERLRPSTVVMLAKAESARSVHELQWHVPGTPLLPVVESALGVMNAVDMAAGTGADPDSAAIDHVRSTVVRVSAAVDLPGPVDSPRPEFREPEAVSTVARHARSLGFRGMLCNHSAHIAPARAATGLGNLFRRAFIGAAS